MKSIIKELKQLQESRLSHGSRSLSSRLSAKSKSFSPLYCCAVCKLCAAQRVRECKLFILILATKRIFKKNFSSFARSVDLSVWE